MNLDTSYEKELDRYFTNYRKYKEMSKYFTGKEKEILLTLSNGFKQETKTILKKALPKNIFWYNYRNLYKYTSSIILIDYP